MALLPTSSHAQVFTQDGNVYLQDAAGRTPALVVQPNLPAAGGLVHVIDAVLLPRALAAPQPAAPQPQPAPPSGAAGRAASAAGALLAALLAAALAA